VQPVDATAELVLGRNHELRRRRGRRRSHVGDEVGDGDVGFVADRRNHGKRHPRDGARDGLRLLDLNAAQTDAIADVVGAKLDLCLGQKIL